jgi:hypothetical protein
MPRQSQPASSIDPRSADVVLFYNGGPRPRDVPARDLHGGDLARILYIRAHIDLESGRPKPATAAELEALATELSSLGSFWREGAEIEPSPVLVEGDVLTEPIPEAPAPPAEPEATA